jgi:hypothetical protein
VNRITKTIPFSKQKGGEKMKTGAILGAVSAVAAFAVPAHAQDLRVNITSITKGMSGSARVVNMAGNYATATGVNLTRVQINALDSSGRLVSSAAGSFNRSTRLWSAGVGDFRLAYFYVSFTVSTPRGNFTYSSSTYRW